MISDKNKGILIEKKSKFSEYFIDHVHGWEYKNLTRSIISRFG